MDFVECPEEGCGLPAEVLERFSLYSTSGPVLHLATLCVNNHRRTYPIN